MHVQYPDQNIIHRVNIFWAQGELGENEMVNLEDWRTVQVVKLRAFNLQRSFMG